MRPFHHGHHPTQPPQLLSLILPNPRLNTSSRRFTDAMPPTPDVRFSGGSGMITTQTRMLINVTVAPSSIIAPPYLGLTVEGPLADH